MAAVQPDVPNIIEPTEAGPSTAAPGSASGVGTTQARRIRHPIIDGMYEVYICSHRY